MFEGSVKLVIVNPECRKYHEHITAAVDNVLGHQELEKLEAHLAQCSECKSEFEAEKFARNIVKSQCRRMRAPGHMLDRINEQLSVHQPPVVQKSPWWQKLLKKNF